MGNGPIKSKLYKKQNFVGDSAFNDLLNETAQGDTNTESSMAPVNLSQPFESAAPIPTEAMPAQVANVVNKDYRELMRAMDKRKNSRP